MIKKFKHWFMLCAVMMLTAVCFSACGDDKDEPKVPETADLVGTWVSTKIVSLQAPGTGADLSDYMKYTYVFKNDGTYTAEFQAYDFDEGWEGDTQTGSYSLEGNELMMTRILFGTVMGPYNMYTIDKLTANTLVLLAKNITTEGSNAGYVTEITLTRQ